MIFQAVRLFISWMRHSRFFVSSLQFSVSVVWLPSLQKKRIKSACLESKHTSQLNSRAIEHAYEECQTKKKCDALVFYQQFVLTWMKANRLVLSIELQRKSAAMADLSLTLDASSVIRNGINWFQVVHPKCAGETWDLYGQPHNA